MDWIIGDRTGYQIIARSQFSNLLPILVLALGIDDSLHALHRYKEREETALIFCHPLTRRYPRSGEP